MRVAWWMVSAVAVVATASGIVATRTAASAEPRVEHAALTAEMWGQGLLSTPWDELNTVFSPDGKELFWSVALPEQNGGVIMMAKLVNGNGARPRSHRSAASTRTGIRSSRPMASGSSMSPIGLTEQSPRTRRTSTSGSSRAQRTAGARPRTSARR